MKNNIIKYLLGPIFLLQGMWVRKVTPVLPEPPGERQGIAGQGPILRLLILGDSAAAGVGVNHQQQALLGKLVAQLAHNFTVHFTLTARSAVTTRQTIKHLAKIEPAPFDVVVTSLGVNDITAGIKPGVWIKQQQTLRTELTERFSAPWLIITSVPPMGQFSALPQPLRWYLGRVAEQFNTDLKLSLQHEQKTSLLELDLSEDAKLENAADGFHPGASAYALWGKTAAEVISSKLAN